MRFAGKDLGPKLVALALGLACRKVVTTGTRQTPATIAEAALQEDVEAVGLSILSGAHSTLVPRVREELRARLATPPAALERLTRTEQRELRDLLRKALDG